MSKITKICVHLLKLCTEYCGLFLSRTVYVQIPSLPSLVSFPFTYFAHFQDTNPRLSACCLVPNGANCYSAIHSAGKCLANVWCKTHLLLFTRKKCRPSGTFYLFYLQYGDVSQDHVTRWHGYKY